MYRATSRWLFTTASISGVRCCLSTALMLAPAYKEGTLGLAPERARQGRSLRRGVAHADLQQHMADLHGALLGRSVQGCAFALLVALEVGVQVVHCRESPQQQERVRGALAKAEQYLLQKGFSGPPPGALFEPVFL